MARSDDAGFYFNFAKHLSERHISISRIAKASGESQSTIRAIRSASRPVEARSIRFVIDTLNNLAEPSSDLPRLDFEKEFRPESQIELPLAPDSVDPLENLGALEYAALGLTNAQAWAANDSPDDFRLLTSKQVYAFLPKINEILEKTAGDDALFERELEKFQIDVDRLFSRVDQSLSISLERGSSSFDALLDDQNFRVEASLQRANLALRNLEGRGLIVDPIVETIGMFSIAVVGVLPLSFTKRTDDGDVVYRKVSAMIWEYEYLNEQEKQTVSFHVKADKLVGAIKFGVAKANKILNGDDE